MTHIRVRLLWFAGLCAVAVVCGAGVAYMRSESEGSTGVAAESIHEQEADDDEVRIAVKAVRPRRDPGFVISVQELASVEAYFTADLYSRVAGSVKYIQKDIGNRVAK